MRGRAGPRCGAKWLAVVTIGLSSLLLASCVKPTVFPRYLTVADVINNVKCELYLAIEYAIVQNQKSVWLDPWTAKFSVQLQVKRQTVGNGGFTFVVPYNVPVGVFTLGVGGSLDKSGQSRMVFDFMADSNLKTFRATDKCDYQQQLSSRNNLAGETGLRLWFGNVIDGINRAKVESKSLTYTLEFVTTVDGNIKPSFKSTFPSARVFGGDFGLVRRRTDSNMLTVVFAPPAAATPAFAVTDLGKALARIEALLQKVESKRITAREEVGKAQDATERVRSQHRSSALESSEEKNLKDRLDEATGREKDKLDDLNTIELSIEMLKSAREGLRASAAAGASPAGRGATDQQLNQLLLLDAIRDIPR